MTIAFTITSEMKLSENHNRKVETVVVTMRENDLECSVNVVTDDVDKSAKLIQKIEKKIARLDPRAHLGYIGDRVVPFYTKIF